MKPVLSLMLAALIGLAAPATQAATDLATLPQTASHKAYAELRKAQRKDGLLTIELRFLTDYAGYSGEVIYPELADAEIFVETDSARFALAKDDAGKTIAPDALQLKFNYDPAKNPRVGTWKATFEAPPADVMQGRLILPNIAPIPFQIKDR